MLTDLTGQIPLSPFTGFVIGDPEVNSIRLLLNLNFYSHLRVSLSLYFKASLICENFAVVIRSTFAI